jgi:cold shock CspA family protein
LSALYGAASSDKILLSDRKASRMTNSTMTATARLAAKLLASRQTSQDEVGELIRHVHVALARLGETPESAATPPPIETATEATAAAPRRKPRERRAAAEPPAVAPTEPAPPPPAPKLVRRAEVAPAPQAAVVAPLAAPSTGTVRGIVRWFDPKSGKGALRLPGYGDVGFEAQLLAESGITRLFKGQEVEASLSETGGSPQVKRLVLPGAVTAAPLGGGVVRGRHARPVVVELKREALRRAAARAEAELVLGSGRTR